MLSTEEAALQNGGFFGQTYITTTGGGYQAQTKNNL